MATGSQRPESLHGRITWPRVLSPRALAPFGRQSVLGESAPHSMCLIFVVGQSLCALWLRFTCRGREMLLRKAAGALNCRYRSADASLSADVGILGDTTNFVDLGGGGGYVSRDAASPPAAHPRDSNGQNVWHEHTYDELQRGIDWFANSHHRLSGEIEHDEGSRCRHEMVQPDADVQMGQVWKILFMDSEAMMSTLLLTEEEDTEEEDCGRLRQNPRIMSRSNRDCAEHISGAHSKTSSI